MNYNFIIQLDEYELLHARCMREHNRERRMFARSSSISEDIVYYLKIHDIPAGEVHLKTERNWPGSERGGARGRNGKTRYRRN